MVCLMHCLLFIVLFSTAVLAEAFDEERFAALVKRVESVEKDNVNLLSEVIQLRQTLKHSVQRRQERSPAIGFTASISKHLTSLGNQHTIVFDKVVSNFANSYDNITGFFVAPERGVYAFFSNIMSEVSDGLSYIETEIVKEGVQLAEMYSGAQKAFDSSSNMAVASLEKGDHVWVRVHGTWSNNFSIHCCFSTFSGFLVGEDISYENIVG